MTFVKLEVALAMLEEHKLPEDSPYSDDRAMAGSYNLAIENAIEALRSLPTDDGWEDIATAPRDGSTFLTYIPPCEKVPEPMYDFAEWRETLDCFVQRGCGFQFVTHWKPLVGPLPAPPSD